MAATNKTKILNDPIYGFITIPGPLIFDLMEHPYFQRLRRISQLGLTYLVYPGAYHTRFHHALGAMHLMERALKSLQSKGHHITEEESEAVLAAILLHDIGHGPFSHALEKSLIPDLHHEELSLRFMQKLNVELHGALDMAITIFKNEYPKGFLHQLISSQLDVDRLDYLRRDSFYTGVSEGQVNTERLITMYNVADDQLVVDQKGIYSVEKFIVARRLMYWQVYLHKTVLAAEFLIVQILRRTREIYRPELAMPSVLRPFVSGELHWQSPGLLEAYAQLDDYDLMAAFKEWLHGPDPLLSQLCGNLLHRRLPGVRYQGEPYAETELKALRQIVAREQKLSEAEAGYLVFTERIQHTAYDVSQNRIELLYRDGRRFDFLEAADQENLHSYTKAVTKYFLFAPKGVFSR